MLLNVKIGLLLVDSFIIAKVGVYFDDRICACDLHAQLLVVSDSLQPHGL